MTENEYLKLQPGDKVLVTRSSQKWEYKDSWTSDRLDKVGTYIEAKHSLRCEYTDDHGAYARFWMNDTQTDYDFFPLDILELFIPPIKDTEIIL